MANVVQQADRAGLMTSDHFTVDGTLIEACAYLKTFKRKDGTRKGPDDVDKGNPTVNFHGEKRSNKTHESKTDPEARLIRKSNGTTAKLSFAGHALMENANGLLLDVMVTQATGTSGREAAWDMISQLPGDARITVGADKAYDVRDFVGKLREMKVTPHIAQNKSARRRSAIDDRTTRHRGFAISQRCRKLVEESFGWGKTQGPPKTASTGPAQPPFAPCSPQRAPYAFESALRPGAPGAVPGRGASSTVCGPA
jgi:hypothetical protein